MTPLRARSVVLALALALAPALAGCAKQEGVQSASAVAMGAIDGVVTDATLSPLKGATVTVDKSNASATTDATGAFHLTVPPGEWTVLASAPDHLGAALRARADAGGAPVKLAFALLPKPTQAAHVEVLELKGLVSCGAAVKNANASMPYACGKTDPNERTQLKASAPSGAGVAGAVIELVWSATTPASKRLELAVSAVSGDKATPLGSDEGEEHIAIVIPLSALESVLASGASELRFDVTPTGSVTDEEAALDAGAAFQQPFTVYASSFYNAPPSGGYSALRTGTNG